MLVTGVAGSGKTTVGRRVASRLGWRFVEGDDYHPYASRAKMARGIALDEADRLPWLEALRGRIDRIRAAGGHAVIACSALRRAHREALVGGHDDVLLVHLSGDHGTIHARIAGRAGHYFKPHLLQSQFDALELPEDALTIDVREPVEVLVDRIVAAVGPDP